MEIEDLQDQERKELQSKVTTLEGLTRQLELKTKNYADQSEYFASQQSLFLHIRH